MGVLFASEEPDIDRIYSSRISSPILYGSFYTPRKREKKKKANTTPFKNTNQSKQNKKLEDE